MYISLHKNARTSIKIRAEIAQSQLSVNAIAFKYGISWSTAKKWKNSATTLDKSSKPHNLHTDLTQAEEDLICFQRKQFKSTIVEIYTALEPEFTGKKIYPMKIYRCLKRYGLEVLPQELKQAERKIKKFKKYGIGYLHIDFIFCKRFQGKRYYVFTCIDRISKLAFVMLTNSRKTTESVRFLQEVLNYYPYQINYILTDNGSEFNDKVNQKHPFIKPKHKHAFVALCQSKGIVYRSTQFKHPWTNGMVERFNRKIQEKVIHLRYFDTIDDLAHELVEYINRYNFQIRLQAINYQSPINYLEKNNRLNKTRNQLTQTLTTYRY
jgi:transposase InsO family protein